MLRLIVSIYIYYPLSAEIRLPKDSVSSRSPMEVHKLIKKLKGGLR